MNKKIINTFFSAALMFTSIKCMEHKDPSQVLTELEQTFIYAARDGKIETVKSCVARQVDINVRDKDGFTALNKALFYSRYDTAVYLLNHKNIEVNIPSETGYTPLHLVCGSCNKFTLNEKTKLTILLLAAGANTDAKNFQITPLHNAFQQPFSEPVELLVAAGASMMPRPNGLTPLQEANKEKNIGHVRALLKSPKITSADIQQALRFNRNTRKDLLSRLRVKLGQCYKFIYTPSGNEHLHKLRTTLEISTAHCLSNQTVQTFNERYRAFLIYLQNNPHHCLDATSPMNEIEKHQEIYRVLFSCYRTQRMLDWAHEGTSKQFPKHKLFFLPPEIRRMISGLAAQPDFLTKDEIKKLAH